MLISIELIPLEDHKLCALFNRDIIPFGETLGGIPVEIAPSALNLTSASGIDRGESSARSARSVELAPFCCSTRAPNCSYSSTRSRSGDCVVRALWKERASAREGRDG